MPGTRGPALCGRCFARPLAPGPSPTSSPPSEMAATAVPKPGHSLVAVLSRTTVPTDHGESPSEPRSVCWVNTLSSGCVQLIRLHVSKSASRRPPGRRVPAVHPFSPVPPLPPSSRLRPGLVRPSPLPSAASPTPECCSQEHGGASGGPVWGAPCPCPGGSRSHLGVSLASDPGSKDELRLPSPQNIAPIASSPLRGRPGE